MVKCKDKLYTVSTKDLLYHSAKKLYCLFGVFSSPMSYFTFIITLTDSFYNTSWLFSPSLSGLRIFLPTLFHVKFLISPGDVRNILLTLLFQT